MDPLCPVLIFCLDGYQDTIVPGHSPPDHLPLAAAGPEGGGHVEGLPAAGAEAEAEISATSSAGGDPVLHYASQAQQQLCGLHAVAQGRPPRRRDREGA